MCIVICLFHNTLYGLILLCFLKVMNEVTTLFIQLLLLPQWVSHLRHLILSQQHLTVCLRAQSNSRPPGLLKCTLCPPSVPEHRTSTLDLSRLRSYCCTQTSIQSCTDCGSIWNIQWTTRPQKSTTYQVSFVRSFPIRFLNRTGRHGELTNGSLVL